MLLASLGGSGRSAIPHAASATSVALRAAIETPTAADPGDGRKSHGGAWTSVEGPRRRCGDRKPRLTMNDLSSLRGLRRAE